MDIQGNFENMLGQKLNPNSKIDFGFLTLTPKRTKVFEKIIKMADQA